jgi:hypothetical protein
MSVIGRLTATCLLLFATQANALIVEPVVTFTNGAGQLRGGGIERADIGDTIAVRIDVSNPSVTDLSGLFVSVQVDPPIWEYVGGTAPSSVILATQGSGLDRFAGPFQDPADPPGWVRALSYARPGSQAANGTEVGVVTLEFIAIARGNAVIATRLQQGDDIARTGGVSDPSVVVLAEVPAEVLFPQLPAVGAPGLVLLAALLAALGSGGVALRRARR